MNDQRRGNGAQAEQRAPVSPVCLDVEYPENLDRLLLFFKWLLVVLLSMAAVLHETIGWPSGRYETVGCIIAIVFSSLPILFALVDVVIARVRTAIEKK